MCGKALPDLVKRAGRVVAPVSTPVVNPTPAPPKSAPPRAENPNRDLSYLLHDDHVPARTSRAPFIVGGLVLAAVAAFFAMRGGGKPGASGAAASDATAAQTTDGSAAGDAHPTATPANSEPSKSETAKAEPAPAEPATAETKAEPEKATPSAAEVAPPAKAARHAAPVAKAAPPPQPSRPLKKPSPAKQVDVAEQADSPVAPSNDCEKQMPSLRKAAARGDAKARADLGLAYYAGRCVPRDLPTAYHWYALVLRTEPDSPKVSAQLEAIWKQMSPAERQLALKAQ